MAQVLAEPFDSFAAWVVTSTPVIVAGRTGTAAEINSISDRLDYNVSADHQTDTFTVGFAWRSPVLQASHTIIGWRGDAGATNHVSLTARSDGRLGFDRAGTTIGTQLPAGTVASATWYYLEATVKLHDTAGAVALRINGALVINSTGLDTRNGGLKPVFDQLRLATPSGSTGGINHYDDLYLRDDGTATGDPTVTPATAGCPFGPSFPGWRILVEAFYDQGRTYGQGTYGSDFYGDPHGGAQWVDITTPSFSLEVLAGSADAAPVVPVSEFTLELQDDLGAWWDYATPARYNLPAVGTPIRFGLIDPGRTYRPLGAGHVDAIVDEHDTPPRVVTVTAYGNMAVAVASRAGWQRAAETAPVRLDALVAAANLGPVIEYPAGRSPALRADAAVRTINLRDELDRTAISASWYMTEDRAGRVRFRVWPHVTTGATLIVSDCPQGTELLAHLTRYIADTAALLNAAIVANDAVPPVSYESTGTVSTAKYGRRTEALGFPYTGLAFADLATGQYLADAARNRYQDVVNRVESFDVDTAADRGWLEVLAGLDIGRPVQVVRRGVAPYTLDTLAVGYHLTLTRDRATATVYVSTLTPTT